MRTGAGYTLQPRPFHPPSAPFFSRCMSQDFLAFLSDIFHPFHSSLVSVISFNIRWPHLDLNSKCALFFLRTGLSMPTVLLNRAKKNQTKKHKQWFFWVGFSVSDSNQHIDLCTCACVDVRACVVFVCAKPLPVRFQSRSMASSLRSALL